MSNALANASLPSPPTKISLASHRCCGLYLDDGLFPDPQLECSWQTIPTPHPRTQAHHLTPSVQSPQACLGETLRWRAFTSEFFLCQASFALRGMPLGSQFCFSSLPPLSSPNPCPLLNLSLRPQTCPAHDFSPHPAPSPPHAHHPPLNLPKPKTKATATGLLRMPSFSTAEAPPTSIIIPTSSICG